MIIENAKFYEENIAHFDMSQSKNFCKRINNEINKFHQSILIPSHSEKFFQSIFKIERQQNTKSIYIFGSLIYRRKKKCLYY